MSLTEARNVAEILGVRPRAAQSFTSLDFAKLVVKGFPVAAIDRVCGLVAPDDKTLRNRIVSRATLTRRQKTAERRLSAEESDKLARLAHLWAVALEVWGSEPEARRFLGEPHPLLGRRAPRDVAVETEVGARAVEDLLGRLKHGSAL